MKPPAATVGFTEMANGSAEEYALLHRLEQDYIRDLPARLLAAMRELETSLSGYRVSRLTHSLQSATRAHRAGENEEMVVAALLHDLGDALAPLAHGEMAAAILKPYVSARTYWIVKHHGVFQMYYYAHHLGGDRHARAQFQSHKWYQACADFCANYDQNCFDPEYPHEELAFFAPMLRRVFAKPREGFA
ncbi:MAG: HD domain-containing protein [Gammaproteobacteria bacterium]